MAAFHATLEEPAHCSDGFILWGLTSAFGITGPAMDVKDGFRFLIRFAQGNTQNLQLNEARAARSHERSAASTA